MDELAAAFAATPPLMLAVAVASILIASVLVASLLSRTVLKPKNSPPIMALMPVIGGFLKFIGVRSLWASSCWLLRRRATC
jgi:hypothetical protein